MNVGISTACFYPDILTEDTLSIISSLGFQYIEAFLETEYEYEPDYASALKARADSLGIVIQSVHAFPVAFEPYIFDRYQRRKDDSLKVFRKAIRAASILGAKYYTFHGNRAFPGTKDYPRIGGIISELADIAGEYQVILAWENVSWCESGDPMFIEKVKPYLTSENIRFTLDFKQARKSGNTLESYINVMGSRICNVHLNDFDSAHTCLLPGSGSVDFPKILGKLKDIGYRGNLIIEVYRENFQSYTEILDSKAFIEKVIQSISG